MSPKQQTMIAAAYHEAGHAVTATMLGDDIVDVRLNIDAHNTAEIGGGVTRSNRCHAAVENLGLTGPSTAAPAYKQAWETNLIVAFAGPEAQRHHNPMTMRSYRFRNDEAEIATMLDAIEPQQVRQKYRHWGKTNAAQLIRSCWPAVEKVAAALLERGILTGDQVKEIINASVDVRVERPRA